MASEAWEQVKNAEAQARCIIEAAKEESGVELKHAHQQATEMIGLAEREARAAGEQLLKEKADSFAAAKQARFKEIEKEIQGMIAQSEKRIPGAVKLIVEKVVS